MCSRRSAKPCRSTCATRSSRAIFIRGWRADRQVALVELNHDQLPARLQPKVIWEVGKTAAARAGIDKLAPHDLRRTCARLCHLAGGELDQIQFLLGHVSIQTTERYLGCQQKLHDAVNDRLGIEPESVA